MGFKGMLGYCQKHFFDERVDLSRSHTFFFLRALVLNNSNAKRIPAHWPSALGLIYESRVDMGWCDKELPCLLHLLLHV